MRAKIAPLAVAIASLLGSALTAAAQTGEFAVQVPGPVVHDAREIQDQLRDARSAKRVSHATQSYGDPNVAKPVSASGAKGER